MRYFLPQIEKDLIVHSKDEIENKEFIVERLNAIYKTPFKSRFFDNQIIIEKRTFSDFYPFNLFHLASLQFYACSEDLANHDRDKIRFTIKSKLFNELSTYFVITFLIILILGSFLSGKFIIGLITLFFFFFMILFERFVKKFGLSNFEKNWNQYIN